MYFPFYFAGPPLSHFLVLKFEFAWKKWFKYLLNSIDVYLMNRLHYYYLLWYIVLLLIVVPYFAYFYGLPKSKRFKHARKFQTALIYRTTRPIASSRLSILFRSATTLGIDILSYNGKGSFFFISCYICLLTEYKIKKCLHMYVYCICIKSK